MELLSFDFQHDFDTDQRAVRAELKAAVTEGMSGLLEGETGGVEGLPGERGLNRGKHDVRLISCFGLGGHGRGGGPEGGEGQNGREAGEGHLHDGKVRRKPASGQGVRSFTVRCIRCEKVALLEAVSRRTPGVLSIPHFIRMQFIVSSTALLRQLQAISGVLNSSNTLPILDNFLFEIAPGKASISASDLETTMTTTVEVTAEEEGAIAIPAKMLLDILKTFEDLPLTFKVDPKTCGVEMTSEAGKYKLAGAHADEFPRTPELEGAASVTLNSDTLAEAISRTLFAAGSDDLRPVMSGIFFELRSDHLSFVATDAHRLVRYARKDASAPENAEMIVPKKPLNLLKGTLPMTDEVVVSFNEANAHFKYGEMDVVCRLIEGKYPNYEAVIPKDNPNCMTIDRKDFQRSIRRVAIFANKTTHQVRLSLAGSSLTISAEDVDFANEARESLACSYTGDDMEIGFNSRFLLDMLNNLDAQQITLELSAPNRAGIIRPLHDGEATGEDILMLVMPVMLNA